MDDPAAWIRLYLEEDVRTGDVTSAAIPGTGAARLIARQAGFVCGADHAAAVFAQLGARADVVVDDAWVEPGTTVLTIEGPAAAILSAERTALNLLGRMSGIATRTRRMAEALAATCEGSMVAATRKTTPGFRLFEKEAVRRAGGDPHRQGLWDAAMVKDNHREALGITEAVARIRDSGVPITVEVESLEEAKEAATAGAHWILIDNQDAATGKAWAMEIWKDHPSIKVEASGGITESNFLNYGWADRISMGQLTQDVRSLDVSLDWGSA